jgi:hypothetical protein
MPEHSTEKEVEGVKVRETGHKQWEKDYTQSDMEVVYRRVSAQSWDDLIKWLEEEGESDNELTPGEVVAMVEDLRELKREGTPFITDPGTAYQEAHKRRR